MLGLSTCARNLSSLAVGHHSMFVVLSPKDICKAKVFSVLYSTFSVFIHLNDESSNKPKAFMRLFSTMRKSNILSMAPKM